MTAPLTLTVAQIREADRRCIEEIGIPGVVLMERAGGAVFDRIPAGPVTIVCGKGNNGGDGYVVARRALLAGYPTKVIALAAPDTLTGDAAIFARAYLNCGGPIVVPRDDSEIEGALAAVGSRETGVDALLGTGLRGEPRGPFATAIRHWPKVHTISVDIPSGMIADTGETMGTCIRADITVTFQYVKRGFGNEAALEFLGRIDVADIGIPKICAEAARSAVE